MKLTVEFSETSSNLDIVFLENDISMNTTFGEIQRITELVGGEIYEGEYIIVPQTEQQMISTKEKVMTDDLTIKAIPYFDVSNTSGGRTIYIGSEVV